MSLADKLLSACEFERQFHLDNILEWRRGFDLGRASITDFAKNENARLKPLIEKACAVVRAAEAWQDSADDDSDIRTAENLIFALQELSEELK